MKKDIEYYMGLPYKVELHHVKPSEGGGFILEIPELGRLSTNAWGATLDEAYTMLEEVKRANIEDMLAQRLEIPEPQVEKIYSGRVNLRMSPSLHRALADLAGQEGISLNATINNLLHQGTTLTLLRRG
jgi:predicted RNase H-like HicB family nuclease